MTKDKALRLALEALEEVKSWKSPTRWDGCFDKEITAIKEALNGCQCPECQVVLHTSDCAVHNEPAYPKGECNCGTQRKPLTDEMTKQMRESCDSYEMRGAFVDGWLSAEATHGIKGEA
jgi:hypothetical protein